MAYDWLVRVCAPAFIDLTPSLHSHAEALRGLPEITDSAVCASTQHVRSAARESTRNATQDPSWDAAWEALREAQAKGEWTPSTSAIWNAGRDLKREAANQASIEAGRDAAWASAHLALRDNAQAWDASRATVRDASVSAREREQSELTKVVAELKDSALHLLHRMIEV